MPRVFGTKTSTVPEDNSDNFVFCTVVGDKKVGKTCLTHSYAYNSFSENHTATIFYNYPVPVKVGGMDFIISLFDTSGLSNHESLRAYTYEKSEVLVLCFSLCDRESFYNVVNSWLPEIQRHSKRRLPLLLVGTQMDLRSSTHTDQVVRHISLRSSDDEDQIGGEVDLKVANCKFGGMVTHERLISFDKVDRVDGNSSFRISNNQDIETDTKIEFTSHVVDQIGSQHNLMSSNNVNQTQTQLKFRSSNNTNEDRTQFLTNNANQVQGNTQRRNSFNNQNQLFCKAGRVSNASHQVNSQMRLSSSDEVSQAEGQYLSKVIGADCYIECSAKSQEGVQEVFHHVVFSALKYRTKKRKIFNRLLEDLMQVSALFKQCSLHGVFGHPKMSSC